MRHPGLTTAVRSRASGHYYSVLILNSVLALNQTQTMTRVRVVGCDIIPCLLIKLIRHFPCSAFWPVDLPMVVFLLCLPVCWLFLDRPVAAGSRELGKDADRRPGEEQCNRPGVLPEAVPRM